MSPEAYDNIHGKLKNVYDTIHPPNLDVINQTFNEIRNIATNYLEGFKSVTDSGKWANSVKQLCCLFLRQLFLGFLFLGADEVQSNLNEVINISKINFIKIWIALLNSSIN